MKKSMANYWWKIKVSKTGFTGFEGETQFSATFPLFLIKQAWKRGCDAIEVYADGFGPGLGTMGGDWSGIRDSSPKAIDMMLQEALNFLFGEQARNDAHNKKVAARARRLHGAGPD